MTISDFAHNSFEMVFQRYLYYRGVRWIHRFAYIFRYTVIYVFIIYSYASYGKNPYKEGIISRKREAEDIALELIAENTKIDKYNRAIVLMMLKAEGVEECRELDTLDWLLLSNHHKEYGNNEFAFEAAFMAHLKDHKRIKANSDFVLEL